MPQQGTTGNQKEKFPKESEVTDAMLQLQLFKMPRSTSRSESGLAIMASLCLTARTAVVLIATAARSMLPSAAISSLGSH